MSLPSFLQINPSPRKKQLGPEDLHGYQVKAVNHQCSMLHSALWLDMGLGKTVVTLTSLAHLIGTGYLRAALVVAPLRVCRMVWKQEAMDWSHTKHLRFADLTGPRDARLRTLLYGQADVYLINYENLQWLAEVLEQYYLTRGQYPPFDGVVWDELSKMKNSTTKRVDAVLRVLPYIKWRTGLTGTPASNGYKDLHGQYLVLDDGARLGTSKSMFSSRFFYKKGAYKEVPFDETEEQIQALIGDMTLQMAAEDYLKMPDMVVNDIEVDLPPKLRAQYEALEKEFFFQLDSGAGIEVFNKAALTNKCLQFSNGAVFLEPGRPEYEELHDLKLRILEDTLEEAGGSPILCSYQFKPDAERIMALGKKMFPKQPPVNLSKCKSQKCLDEAMARWLGGDLPLLVGHPASMGHGIDKLQKNGHLLFWYGLTWSLDLYKQFNARIRRQGQDSASVICHRAIIKDTLDYAQRTALAEKAVTEDGLRSAVDRYRKEKGV